MSGKNSAVAATDAKEVSDAARAARPYDVVVWGATGFTGTLITQYITKKQHLAKAGGDGAVWSSLRWAIGGRSAGKVKAVVESVNRELVSELKDQTVSCKAEIVIADSSDQSSIDELVQKTRVIISSVGPFRQYGSGLVAACVAYRTDYVDTTGEHIWVKQQIDAHHERATKNGTFIVPMCGFDSIPSDIGTYLLASHIRKTYGPTAELQSAQLVAAAGGGAGASGGTLHTMLDIVEQVSTDRKGFGRLLRNPYVLVPGADQPPKKSWTGGVNEFPLPLKVVDGAGAKKDVWTAPFVMSVANGAVVRRSAHLLTKAKGGDKKESSGYAENFVYRSERMKMGNPIFAMIFILILGVVVLLGSFKAVRNLARKYLLPAQGAGPSKAKRATAWFQSTLIGHGTVVDGGSSVPVDVCAQISGGDPGYDETAKMVTESAMCLIGPNARSKLSARGGVLTPASAFGEVLLDRLSAPDGLKIQVLYTNSLAVAKPVKK